MAPREQLAHARFEFAQYRGWHIAHELCFPEGSHEQRELLDIDIVALGDLLDGLMRAYSETGVASAFPEVLDRLNGAVNHERWAHRILFQRAFWALGDRWDEEASRKILRDFKDVDKLQDESLMTFYLDLMGGEFGFDGRRKLAQRIAAQAKDPAVRLQYRVLDHLELLKIGELTEARQGIEEAISKFEEEVRLGNDERYDGYGDYQHGLALSILGSLASDLALFRRAASSLRRCLSLHEYTDEGRANILQQVGFCYLRCGDLECAREVLQESLSAYPTTSTKVFLAETYVRTRRWTEAAKELDGIAWDSLPDHEKFDWAAVSGELALVSGDESRASAAIGRFESLDGLAALFEKQRHRLVVTLMGIQRPSAGDLARVFDKLEEVVRIQRRQEYLQEAIRSDVEEIASLLPSDGVREALERKSEVENLAADRELARTPGQKVAHTMMKHVRKKLLGNVENGALNAVKDEDQSD